MYVQVRIFLLFVLLLFGKAAIGQNDASFDEYIQDSIYLDSLKYIQNNLLPDRIDKEVRLIDSTLDILVIQFSDFSPKRIEEEKSKFLDELKKLDNNIEQFQSLLKKTETTWLQASLLLKSGSNDAQAKYSKHNFRKEIKHLFDLAMQIDKEFIGLIRTYIKKASKIKDSDYSIFIRLFRAHYKKMSSLLYSEITNMKKEQKELEQALHKLQTDNEATRTELNNLFDDKNNLNAKLAETGDSLRNIELLKATIEHKIDNNRLVIKNLENSKRELEDFLELERDGLERVKNQLFQTEDAWGNSKKQLEKDKIQLENEKEDLEEEIRNLEASKNTLEAENEEMRKHNLRLTLMWVLPSLVILALILLSIPVVRKLTIGLRKLNIEKATEIKLKTQEINLKNKQIQDKTTELEIKNEELKNLLRELNHRIGNNINEIKSLIDLQAVGANMQAKDALKKIKTRINAIGLIHKHIYRSEKFRKHKYKTINLKNYVEDLIIVTVKGSQFDSSLKWKVTGDNIKLDVDLAVNIGIILNELVQNTFKYAFNNRKNPELKVSLKAKAGFLHIGIEDNGDGFPPDFSLDTSKGLGLKILKSFIGTNQLIVKNKEGACIELAYPIYKNEDGIYTKMKNHNL